MGRVRSAAFISIVALAGCVPVNQWHEESYFDQRAYQHNDAAELRGDLEQTIAFLPSIGLKRLEEPKGGEPATEAVFTRDMDDHFHATRRAHRSQQNWHCKDFESMAHGPRLPQPKELRKHGPQMNTDGHR